MRTTLALLIALTFTALSLFGCAVETTNADLAYSDQTELFWQRCALGARWDGEGCVGVPATLSWEASAEACASLGSGFRLPSLEEVASLLGECTEGARAAACAPCLASDECASVLADDHFDWAWTSDRVEGAAMVVDLAEGRIAYDQRTQGIGVRCVLGGSLVAAP